MKKQLSYEERKRIRRAAEDAIDAANPSFGPFVDVVAHPLNILALVDMADRLAAAGDPPTVPPGWDGGWRWMSHPDWNDGEPIPVQTWMDTSGTIYYRPFDGRATEFEWAERDSEWRDVETMPLSMDPQLQDFARQLVAWHGRKTKGLDQVMQGMKPGTKLHLGEGDPNPKTLTEKQALWLRLGIQIALLELGSLPFKIEPTDDEEEDGA